MHFKGHFVWTVLFCVLPSACISSGYSDFENTNNEQSSTSFAQADSDKKAESNASETVKGLAAEMDWVEIPPGKFLMGSPEDEWGRDRNEYLHEVEHSYGYKIAVTEVTCAQWKSLSTGLESLCVSYSDCERCDCTEDDCPVPKVTLENAKIWLDALSVSAGLEPCYENEASWPTPMHCPGYRLPTESEWERAARADDNRATYNGGLSGSSYKEQRFEVLEPIAWCGGGMADEERRARPVAQKLPNSWGLYDMIGNMDELTLWEGVYPNELSQNPYVNSDDEIIVKRGGNFDSIYGGFQTCRAAKRDISYTYFAYGGLRPVRTLPNSQIPNFEPPRQCPMWEAVESLEKETYDMPPIYLQANPQERYVAMTNDNSGYIMFLGVSETSGPFIEVLETTLQKINSGVIRYSAPPHLTTYRPQNIAKEMIADTSADRAVAVLCNSTCSLAMLSSPDENGNRTFDIMEGGEIPSWLGEITDLFFFGELTQIFVAGDGVALFDGTAWHEEIPSNVGRILSLGGHSFSDGVIKKTGNYMAASGEKGLLMLRDPDGWTVLDTQTDVNLNDTAVFSNHLGIENNTIGAMAVGDNGTVVHFKGKEVVSCKLGDKNIVSILSLAVYVPGAYDVLNSDGEQIYVPHTSSSLRPSINNQSPKMAFDTTVVGCGIASNYFYLTETAILGYEPRCPID